MTRSASPARRSVRRIVAAAGTAAVIAGVGGIAASGTAFAGYAPVESATNATGTVSITPGLTGKVRAETAVLSATLGGWSSPYSGPQAGQGQLTAVLSGTASTSVTNLAGSFTLNYPASAGLNPSNGSLALHQTSPGVYSISGSVTSGANVGTVLSFGYLVTGHSGAGTARHPQISQTFVNTAPLQLSRNFG